MYTLFNHLGQKIGLSINVHQAEKKRALKFHHQGEKALVLKCNTDN